MPDRSSSSAEVRYRAINYDYVMSQLKAYAARLANNPDVKAVLLGGSLARGTYTGYSDADVLIICENIPPNPLERYPLFLDPALPIVVEPRAYTPAETVEKIKGRDRFVTETVLDGIVLWGDPRYLEKLRAEIRRQPRQSGRRKPIFITLS